jgi:hypothetical protein
MENLQPETPDDYWCGEWKERITYVFLEDLKKRIDALP